MTGPCIGASFQSVFFANWMMRTTELRELPSLWGIIHNSPKDFSNGFLGWSISPIMPIFIPAGVLQALVVWDTEGEDHPSTSPCTNQLRPREKKRVPMKNSHHWPSKKNGSNEAGQPTIFSKKSSVDRPINGTQVLKQLWPPWRPRKGSLQANGDMIIQLEHVHFG